MKWTYKRWCDACDKITRHYQGECLTCKEAQLTLQLETHPEVADEEA